MNDFGKIIVILPDGQRFKMDEDDLYLIHRDIADVYSYPFLGFRLDFLRKEEEYGLFQLVLDDNNAHSTINVFCQDYTDMDDDLIFKISCLWWSDPSYDLPSSEWHITVGVRDTRYCLIEENEENERQKKWYDSLEELFEDFGDIRLVSKTMIEKLQESFEEEIARFEDEMKMLENEEEEEDEQMTMLMAMLGNE